MKSIQSLVKSAQNYNTSSYQQYSNSLIKQMKGLTKGAMVAVDHLLTLPQYQKSVGLQTLKKHLPQLDQTLNRPFHYQDMADDFYSDLTNNISSMTFYTYSSGAGTGFDPATNARENGYSAPSYYINTLADLNHKLNQYKYVEEMKDPNSDIPTGVIEI